MMNTTALMTRRWALPLLVYGVAAVIITWPLVSQINTHAAGAGYGDTYEVARHVWWAREALLDGRNPFDQPLLAYPDGFASWLQWTHPFQYLAPVPLALIAGPLAAVNLTLLIVLVLNGLAAYRLGLHLSTGSRLAALLGGLVFMAFPAVQGHLSVGHLGILALFPLPLFALCLWRVLFEGAGWRTAIWGGVWLALTALSYVSQIIFTVFPLLLFFGLYLLLWDRRRLFPRGVPPCYWPWLKVIGMAAVGAALLLPFYLPLALADSDEVSAIREPGRVTYSADLLAFISPSPFGPLDDLVPDYTRDALGTNSAEGAGYLGLIAVGLASAALLKRPVSRPWLVVALGAMLFSLGPLLKWRDQPVIITIEDFRSYITLPWALFERLPLIEATRTPGRFNLTTGLALSALVSTGMAGVLQRVRRRVRRIGLTAVLGALMLLEYQLFAPFLTVDARQPDYFRELAARDDVRAVLNLPTNDNLVAKMGLYQQTLHHKPLIAGHVLRRTPQDPALLAILDRAATSDAALIPARREDVPYLLSQAGADRVVVHKLAYANAGAVIGRLASIFGPPEFEDERYAVFAIPRVPEPPPGFALVTVASAEGWSDPVDTGAFTGAFLADEGRWYIYSAAEQYGDLVFRALPYRTPRRIAVWLDDHLIGGGWIGLDEGAGWRSTDRAIRVPLWLSRGFHTLRFEALDGCTAYPFALTCWHAPDLSPDCAPLDPPACISVAFEPPTWEPAGALPTPLDGRLDQGVRLRAYEVRQEPGAVIVRLFWEAERALPDSYALFVHIADPQTGVPLAQFTGFPLLLTTEWADGTRWQTDARIALPDDLPAGTYAINVGWFRPSDGARLGLVPVEEIEIGR